MADMYLQGFNRGPSRALMPAKRRTTGAWRVWITDADGTRMVAHVLEERECFRWAASLWVSRLAPCEVRAVQQKRGGAVARSVLVASDMGAPAPVRAVRYGDARDTWSAIPGKEFSCDDPTCCTPGAGGVVADPVGDVTTKGVRLATKLANVGAANLAEPSKNAGNNGMEVCFAHATIASTGDSCYHATMPKTDIVALVAAAATSIKADPRRALNVRVSPATRDILIREAARVRMETGVPTSASDLIQALALDLDR